MPGLRDPEEIAATVAAVPLPVNVLYLTTGPSVAELAALGVQRVSTGSLLYRAALAATVDIARAVRDGAPVAGGIPSYSDVQHRAP